MELVRIVPQVGRLEWIGIAQAPRGPVHPLTEARLVAGRGIEGEHHVGGNRRRQVTLVQAEHLDVVGRLLGRERVDPALLRRNLALAGINLASLRRRRFRIGEALLQGAGDCHPCGRMEESLGRGGFQAMRGHGGILAVVLEGGTIRLGDRVTALEEDEPPEG